MQIESRGAVAGRANPTYRSAAQEPANGAIGLIEAVEELATRYPTHAHRRPDRHIEKMIQRLFANAIR